MSVGEVVAVIAGLAGLVGALATMRKSGGDVKAALAQIEADREAALAAVEQRGGEIKVENDRAIDERLSRELSRAYAKIDVLEQKVKALEVEPEKIKAVVRRFVYSLHEWARVNGYTDLPWPSDEDMAVMAPEMVHVGVTLPRDEVLRAAAAATRSEPPVSSPEPNDYG